MSEESHQLKRILEGAILAAAEPLSVQKLQSLFDEDEMPESDAVLQALAEIKTACQERGFDLIEVATGWRFQVREDVAQWVNRLWEEKPQKYSRALLETLALIAYRQPLTRGDIEEVRGVAVSSHIIKTLTEREWVKVVGHRDVPGRPALYATTKTFLDYFNLKSLDELPTLGELKDIDSLNQALEFDDGAANQDVFSEGSEKVSADNSEEENAAGDKNDVVDESQDDDDSEEALPDDDTEISEDDSQPTTVGALENENGDSQAIENPDGSDSDGPKQILESADDYPNQEDANLGDEASAPENLIEEKPIDE